MKRKFSVDKVSRKLYFPPTVTFFPTSHMIARRENFFAQITYEDHLLVPRGLGKGSRAKSSHISSCNQKLCMQNLHIAFMLHLFLGKDGSCNSICCIILQPRSSSLTLMHFLKVTRKPICV